MPRAFNFSAGPATLPQSVLEHAQAEMLDYRGTGMSVMEMSHRSPEFQEIIDRAESSLRKLMRIPDDYHVLFLQGGASSQFAMVPMNLFRNQKRADFVNTGSWSIKAIKEANKYGTARTVGSSEDKQFSYIPALDPAIFDPEADYFHLTTNNTIYGTCFNQLPDTGDVPLVGDMSSDILSKAYRVEDFGLIYGGAQKNIGPAGLTLVIVKKDLVGHAMDITPTMLNYETHATKGSMFNTPPTYAIYMAGLVFEWGLELGGINVIEARNRAKADLLYECIDQSDMFTGTVAPADRSIMNVCFKAPTPEQDSAFIALASSRNLKTLKGYRTVGGMRASLYNAMPLEGVEALVKCMQDFERGKG